MRVIVVIKGGYIHVGAVLAVDVAKTENIDLIT